MTYSECGRQYMAGIGMTVRSLGDTPAMWTGFLTGTTISEHYAFLQCRQHGVGQSTTVYGLNARTLLPARVVQVEDDGLIDTKKARLWGTLLVQSPKVWKILLEH